MPRAHNYDTSDSPIMQFVQELQDVYFGRLTGDKPLAEHACLNMLNKEIIVLIYLTYLPE